MAIEAGNVVWNITADLKPLNQALGDSEKAVQSSMGNILKAGQQIGIAFTAIGAGIAGAFGVAVNAAIDYGGTIQDAATKTGIGAEELQKLKFGAEQSGVSFDGLQGAIIKMNKSISEARDGTKAQSEAFQRLGIDLSTLAGLSPDQQFMRIAEALSRVTDPALKTSLAMDLFGKSGAQLIPFLNEGAAGMEALGQKAQELGLVMSGDAVAQAEAFGDQWEAMKLQFQQVAVQLGSALIPALQQLMPRIQEIIGNVIAWVQANPQLTASIATVVGAVGAVMAVLGPFLIMLPGIVSAFSMISAAVPAVGAAFIALTGPVGIVIAALGAIVAAGIYVYNHWEEFKQGAEIIWNALVDVLKTSWDIIVETIIFGAKLVAAPFTSFLDLITDGWTFLGEAAGVVVDVFQGVWDAIIGGFNWVGNQLASLWDWITGLVDSGVQGIVSAINYLSNLFGLGDVFQGGTGDIPGRAVGGPVEGGMPYIVGEQGQELFVPESDGRIVPAGQTAAMMRGGGPVNITINGYNRDPRSLAQEISRVLRNEQMAFARA